MKTNFLKTLTALLLLMVSSIGLCSAETKELILIKAPVILVDEDPIVYAQVGSMTSVSMELIEDMLLRPLGIEQSIGKLDASGIEAVFEKEGLDYKTLNLGAYGKVISLYPADFSIGGVGMARIMFIVNEYAKMAMYESVQSEDYLDVCGAIEKSFGNVSMTKDLTQDGNSNISTFMLSDSLGISVGYLPERQVSMVYIMNMNNLKGFLNQ